MQETEVIEKLIQLAKKNKDILVMWLYGSRAKKTARAQSDYDLAIAFKHFPKDILERTLRPELLSIDWGQALKMDSKLISIVDINLIPIPLAWEVISHGKVLLAKDTLREMREFLRINSMYELDVLYHRKRYGS